MATERNPFEQIPQEVSNVVPLTPVEIDEEQEATFELEPDGGVTVDFNRTVVMEADAPIKEWYENLAENMDDSKLDEIADEVYSNYEADKNSRQEWESMFERGFDLLGLKIQETSEPFEGACTAVHPLLVESAVKFQSKASQELFPSGGPIKTQILGKSTPAREKQANRVKNFMNYQLTEQMPEYFDEFEKMLFHLPLIGSAFKKVYYDANLKRPVSEFVPIDQFYVSYYSSNLSKADRYTHVIYRSPIDLAKDVRSGIYADEDLPDATNPQPTAFASKMDTILGFSPTADSDPQYVLLEQHCYLELDEPNSEKGIALPYIVTVEEQSRKVLCIRRNYKSDDTNMEKISHFVHYRFVPGFGFYGFGLMHFLGNLTMSATAAMRSLIDAGQFANLPGGFKAKGVRMVGNNDPISPGEFKEVESTGIDLSKAIIPLPYKEPSSTLFQMLGFVTAAGQKFADSTEQMVSEASSYGPVGTTMALLEASSKFFSAIHKRLHKAQRDEFRILARIDYDYLPSEYPYEVPFESRSIFKSDFDGRVDVIPVSDPNIPSNAHRLMIAQMAMQMAQQSPPGLFNMEALSRTILSAANMPNLEEILPPKIKPADLDPVSDIMAAVKGIPIAAFTGQNHDAHVQVKMAYLQDPMNGGSPTMQRVRPILEANIQEHMVHKYQEQMDGIAKNALEESAIEQTPEVVEGAMVFAAQQVLNANKASGLAKSPEQQLVILEQKKVELEQHKLQLDAANNAAEAALDAQKLQLEEAKLMKEVVAEGHQVSFRKEKADLDRASKETMKSVELLAKSALEDQKSEMKSLDMMIKMALGEMKSTLDENTLKAKIMEKAEKIESDKNIKMMELVNNIIEQETKGEKDA
jgi:hypothetical protein